MILRVVCIMDETLGPDSLSLNPCTFCFPLC